MPTHSLKYDRSRICGERLQVTSPYFAGKSCFLRASGVAMAERIISRRKPLQPRSPAPIIRSTQISGPSKLSKFLDLFDQSSTISDRYSVKQMSSLQLREAHRVVLTESPPNVKCAAENQDGDNPENCEVRNTVCQFQYAFGVRSLCAH